MTCTCLISIGNHFLHGCSLLLRFTSVIIVFFSSASSCRGASHWDVQKWILLSRNGWVRCHHHRRYTANYNEITREDKVVAARCVARYCIFILMWLQDYDCSSHTPLHLHINNELFSGCYDNGSFITFKPRRGIQLVCEPKQPGQKTLALELPVSPSQLFPSCHTQIQSADLQRVPSLQLDVSIFIRLYHYWPQSMIHQYHHHHHLYLLFDHIAVNTVSTVKILLWF